jgi:hypothetical protein
VTSRVPGVHPARPRPVTGPIGWGWATLAGLVLSLSSAADAQLFLASRPDPAFTVGPLIVRASVAPELGRVTIDVLFSLGLPPGVRPADVAQDLYLLWPGAVSGQAGIGPPDPELQRHVESRGFAVIEEGRLKLLAQSVGQIRGDLPAEPVAGGAPFVTFVRQGGPLGLTAPATYIRIPWTPKLASSDWLLDLRLAAGDLVARKPASWFEDVFRGPRHVFSVSVNDVRSRALFPLYLEHRDRAVRLGDEPSEIVVNFAAADRLKIDEVSPASSSRRPSESLENTEVVSHFLERSEGIRPQTLTIQFGYFSGLQAWAPVLIPTLFFLLGNLAAVLVRRVAERVGSRLAGRVHFGPPGDAPRRRETGTLLPRETLARIAPGVTTYTEVLALCGPGAEQQEKFPSPEHRTLVYRGRRVVPRDRRLFGWLTTVSAWDVEHHEVQIEFEGDVVSDVKALVRRSQQVPKPPDGEAAAPTRLS